jgi:hydroxymethylbilane synthase
MTASPSATLRLRLGTRGSDLARMQSQWVAARLADTTVEFEIISTAGDRSTAPTFGAIGPQGVFVREIEQALTEQRIDCAVHSYKDLPTRSPDGLTIAAVPPRVDPADWLLIEPRAHAPEADSLLPLIAGCRLGTSSARRQAWLRHYRADLELKPLRGNVPTRIQRLRDGDYGAIVLAGAGIERLNEGGDRLSRLLDGLVRVRLDPRQFVPAPGQGALAVQCRASDNAIRERVGLIDDASTRTAVDLERALLARAEGGCDAAFGAYCLPTVAGFEFIAMAEAAGRVRAEDPGSR